MYLRLTMSTRPPCPVLGIRKNLLDKAGLTDMTQVLRDAGYQAMSSKNTRYVIMDLVHQINVFIN